MAERIQEFFEGYILLRRGVLIAYLLISPVVFIVHSIRYTTINFEKGFHFSLPPFSYIFIAMLIDFSRGWSKNNY